MYLRHLFWQTAPHLTAQFRDSGRRSPRSFQSSIMSSRYQQQFTIPDGFPALLKDFTREILRSQVGAPQAHEASCWTCTTLTKHVLCSLATCLRSAPSTLRRRGARPPLKSRRTNRRWQQQSRGLVAPLTGLLWQKTTRSYQKLCMVCYKGFIWLCWPGCCASGLQQRSRICKNCLHVATRPSSVASVNRLLTTQGCFRKLMIMQTEPSIDGSLLQSCSMAGWACQARSSIVYLQKQMTMRTASSSTSVCPRTACSPTALKRPQYRILTLQVLST